MIDTLVLTPVPSADEALRADVRQFIATTLASVAPDVRARSWMGFDAEFSRAMAQRGWLGITLPLAYGGANRSAFARFVLVEELLAAGGPVSAHWIADRQSAPLILKYGTEAQKQFYVPRICRGEAFFCIGMSEPGAGSDLVGVQTRATKTDGGWPLSGQKSGPPMPPLAVHDGAGAYFRHRRRPAPRPVAGGKHTEAGAATGRTQRRSAGRNRLLQRPHRATGRRRLPPSDAEMAIPSAHPAMVDAPDASDSGRTDTYTHELAALGARHGPRYRWQTILAWMLGICPISLAVSIDAGGIPMLVLVDIRQQPKRTHIWHMMGNAEPFDAHASTQAEAPVPACAKRAT